MSQSVDPRCEAPRVPRARRCWRTPGRFSCGGPRARSAGSHGFTLIELVVTLALIGLVALLALPVADLARTRQMESELRVALREIRTAIDAYKRAADAGVIAKGLTDTGYPPNLQILADGEVNTRDPKAGRLVFIRRIPRDPFATDGNLAAAQSWGRRAYGSPVDAPVEGSDVFDVYSRSTRLGMNGLAYNKW